jgi:hypothetical protein
MVRDRQHADPKKPFWQTYRGHRILRALIAGDRVLKRIVERPLTLDPTQNARSYIELWQRDLHAAFKREEATDADLDLADKLTDFARMLTERAERAKKAAAQTEEAQKSRTDAAETRRKAILQDYRLKKQFPRHGDGAKLAKQYQVSPGTISADLEWVQAELRK